jgi:hypothetical protein
MRRDYLIAIILAVSAIPGGTALMAAPEYLHLTGTSLAFTFWGGVVLTLILILAAVAVALRGEAQSPPKGHRRRMVAIWGMAVFGCGFLICAIWFFAQRPDAPKNEQTAKPPESKIGENPPAPAQSTGIRIKGRIENSQIIVGGVHGFDHGLSMEAGSSAENSKIEVGKITGPKNSPTISAGGNVTIGHIGDVTINQAPQPELKLGPQKAGKNADGTFALTVEAEVISPYPPGSMRLEAWAPGIMELQAVPQRSGMSMTGHSGVRPEYAFTTLMQPFGKYLIVVRTKEAANIDLKYDFDK